MPRTAIVQPGDDRQTPQGEQNRRRLGEGPIPLQDIVQAFENAGYAGYYDVELMGEDIEASNYQDLLRGSLDVVSRLGRGSA